MGLERGGIHGSRYAGGKMAGHMLITPESMTLVEWVSQEDLTKKKVLFLDRRLEGGSHVWKTLYLSSLKFPLTLLFSWPESE